MTEYGGFCFALNLKIGIKNNQFASGYFLRPRLFASALDFLPNLSSCKLKIGRILNGCFAVLILAKNLYISVAKVTNFYFKNIVIVK